jgi:hypothetical protein
VLHLAKTLANGLLDHSSRPQTLPAPAAIPKALAFFTAIIPLNPYAAQRAAQCCNDMTT